MNDIGWPGLSLPLAFVAAWFAACPASEAEAKEQANMELLSSGEVLLFGQWAVGCDNMRRCTTIVPLSEPSILEPPHYLQVTYTDGSPARESFAIMRDGTTVAELTPEATATLKSGLLAHDGPQTIALAEISAHLDVPRDGFADVVSVLGAWRSSPPVAATPTDVVTPMPALRLANVIPPLKVAGAAKICPAGHMGQSLQAWRGVGGQTLWRAGCGNEGLNSSSFWYLAGPQGAPATEVKFEDQDGSVTLYNSWFDADTGYLRSTHYFGHYESYVEDCGIYRAYSWGVGGMKLVEKRVMPRCGTGIGPGGWIVVYRATVLNGPDSRP